MQNVGNDLNDLFSKREYCLVTRASRLARSVPGDTNRMHCASIVGHDTYSSRDATCTHVFGVVRNSFLSVI